MASGLLGLTDRFKGGESLIMPVCEELWSNYICAVSRGSSTPRSKQADYRTLLPNKAVTFFFLSTANQCNVWSVKVAGSSRFQVLHLHKLAGLQIGKPSNGPIQVFTP